MSYVLIHYPGCSSSKKGLHILREAGIEPELRLYMLKANRLDEAELRHIDARMGSPGPRSFMRAMDARRAGLAEVAGDDDVFAAMAANPKLIQRPIGMNGDRAVLGRPNARLLDIV